MDGAYPQDLEPDQHGKDCSCERYVGHSYPGEGAGFASSAEMLVSRVHFRGLVGIIR